MLSKIQKLKYFRDWVSVLFLPSYCIILAGESNQKLIFILLPNFVIICYPGAPFVIPTDIQA